MRNTFVALPHGMEHQSASDFCSHSINDDVLFVDLSVSYNQGQLANKLRAEIGFHIS